HAGDAFLTGCGDGKVRLYQGREGQLLHEFTGHNGGIYALAVSADGRWMLSGGHDQHIRLWDLPAPRLVQTLHRPSRALVRPGHSGAVVGLGFAPDGKRYASCSQDRTIRLWGLPAAKPSGR